MGFLCGEWGLLFLAVRGLPIEVASLLVELGLQGTQVSLVTALRLWSTGSVVVVLGFSLSGMWDLP